MVQAAQAVIMYNLDIQTFIRPTSRPAPVMGTGAGVTYLTKAIVTQIREKSSTNSCCVAEHISLRQPLSGDSSIARTNLNAQVVTIKSHRHLQCGAGSTHRV